MAEDDEASVEVAALPVRLHPSPALKEGAWAFGVGQKWLEMCLDILVFPQCVGIVIVGTIGPAYQNEMR